jgi:hypothetical protein
MNTVHPPKRPANAYFTFMIEFMKEAAKKNPEDKGARKEAGT